MNFAIFPIPFYVAVILIVIGIAYCASGLRQGWGLPGIVVMLTVAAWYVGDALYNDYESYFLEFGRDTLEGAWWQTSLFILAFLTFLKPTSDAVTRGLRGRSSFAMLSYERKLVNEGEVQRQIDVIFNLLFSIWICLMLVALSRVNWDFVGLFFPYLSNGGAHPWLRGRLGGQLDALISLAKHLQLFLTAAFGLIWAVSRNPRTRNLAGICFLLSAPFFVFGRARNVMLAVVTPGLLAWIIIRLQTTWLVRAFIIAGAFLAINFWMIFVLQNRNVSVLDAIQQEGAVERAMGGEHRGLNMFKELSYINHFMKLGTYQPNWGQRYWAEIVNPIPRGLWPNKPDVGLDYAMARGMGEGGYAAQKQEGVAATISTGMIGQGVVNFGTIIGPVFAAFLLALWAGLLARQDLMAQEYPARFLLYALGIILTFNMGRDITFLVSYPFFFGLALVAYFEKKKAPKTVVASYESGVRGRPETRSRGDKVKGEKVGRWEGGEEMRDERRDVGAGGSVRTLPASMPKRVASWMPRRLRKSIMQQAANDLEEAQNGAAVPQNRGQGSDAKRPRQLGVPFQNYRRYRG